MTYGDATELRATLEYDISQEQAFDYSGLSMDEIIRHLARFISRLWQIHVFGEGNTRTTSVFFIPGKNNPLQNRTMHISGALKQDSGSIKQDFDKLTGVGISVRSTNNNLILMNRFGLDKAFGRMDIARELEITKSPASEILNNLLSIGAIVSVTGAGKGKYRVNPQFFN